MHIKVQLCLTSPSDFAYCVKKLINISETTLKLEFNKIRVILYTHIFKPFI